MDSRLERLAAGGPPRVLDLFAGCGGLSLGFQRAGFHILGGIEKDPRAAWTHAANLHREAPSEIREQLARSRDISQLPPEEILADLGQPTEAVDVLIGGPPCQAYARVGRAKLRDIREHPEAFRHDERGRLYLQYLRYVEVLEPLAVLIENVPDILNYGGRNLASEIASHLHDLGYRVACSLLNAAHYGVPQTRRRVYILACRQDLGLRPAFPRPLHRIASLPSGYREFTTLLGELRRKEASIWGSPDQGAGPEEDMSTLPLAVTVKEAIGDLPALTAHLTGEMAGGRRRFDALLPYAAPPRSDFAREMREGWPGFEGGAGVSDHVIRLLPRDYPIFARMQADDDYPKAHQIAMELLAAEVERQGEKGRSLVPGSPQWETLKKAVVPPYDPSKFPNKWRKMAADTPARTLLAHLAHDGYTHIHPDDSQARTISVREAARLQSFPDGFRFYEAMNPAFRMIGNAVPPKMAFHLARPLFRQLRKAAKASTSTLVRGG